jgi:hypothetical protein
VLLSLRHAKLHLLGSLQKKTESGKSRACSPGSCPPFHSDTVWVLVGCLNNQVIDDAMRFIDMFESTMTQSVGKPVIFSFRNVTMRLIEQLERPVIPASAPKVCINHRMIVQILPVINGSALDFTDCLIDLGNGVLFLSVHPSGVGLVLKMSAGVPQIRKCVEVRRMILSKTHRGTKSSK